jgi:hypothetical protein
MRIAIALLAIFVLLGASSCKQLEGKVKGNITGKVLNADGSGRGYVSVALLDEGGKEVQRMTSEDSGNFFFSGVPAGTYSFRVEVGQGIELPSEPLAVKLGLGKTKTTEIKLKPEVEKQQ